MTSLADRTIAALRSTHDELAALVPGLSDDQLSSRSGASEWSVAQVLSHLGSGAEITLAGLTAAVGGTEPPGSDFNHSVWARWDASGPRDQATGFLEHDAALVGTFEALSPEQRESISVAAGFLPEPLSLASAAGMRLNEAVLHSWDARVALEPTATLDAGAAEVLTEHLSSGLGFILGFSGKADVLAEPAIVQVEGSEVALVVTDTVSLSPAPGDPTATFTGGPEAVVRLVAGRLTAPYTPPGVGVDGNLTLDDLRRVFPGY
jgi:uncharacterized protein (TIGR03083 family)